MSKKKNLSCFVLALFMFTIVAGFGAADAASSLTDVTGNWAQSQIEALVGQSVISGYPDNTFRPNNPVTRAEFMSMTNRAFSFTNTVDATYTDVKTGDWFAADIAKAKAAGYISGYSDGSMKPDNQISRQEAAVIIAKILKLDTSATNSLTFSDAASVPEWSKNAVAAVVKAGYMSGYPDGTFKALNSITRAEAASILSRTMPEKTPAAAVYDKAGTYGPATGVNTIDGNATISAAGVVLQNTTITGDLLIADSVGDGNVTLNNVTVKGTTNVKGGGDHSIYANNCNLGKVNVNKAGGTSVRIVVTGTTVVAQITLASGAVLEESNLTGNGFEGVEISSTGAITLKGNFDSVTIEGSNANVTVASGTIASLTIADSATGANVNIAGQATVTTFTANAAVAITGTGTITTANYNVSGSTTTIKASTVNTAAGVTAPTASTSSGGGGGSGGSSSVTLSNVAVTGSGVHGTYSSNAVTITGASDSMLTGITVTTSPASASCTFTNLTASSKGINLPLATTFSCQNSVSISELMGDLDTGDDGVSLGSLKRILGSSFSLTGTLTASGYSGTNLSITITLNVSGDIPAFVSNNWVEVSRSGNDVTATIINDALVSTIAESGIGMIWGGGLPQVSTDNSHWYNANTTAGQNSIKAAVAALTGEAWNTMYLSDMAGHTVYFKDSANTVYTLTFEI